MNRFLHITSLLVLTAVTLRAQASRVDFSAFGMGFGILPSSNSNIIGIAGEPTIGNIEAQNTRIESGFVNNVNLGNTGLIFAVQSEIATLGRPVGIRMFVPAHLQTTAESLFYRKGGEQTFSRIALARVGDTLSAAIPAVATTIRGVEYYISAASAQGPIRFPGFGVDTLRVNIETFMSPSTFRSRVYKMISVPVELANQSLLSVLGDDFGSYDPNVWRLFRWENNRNVEFPDIRAHFTPGEAFWLVSHAANGFGIDNGKSVPSLLPLSIVLDTGWNQIANPFAFRVSMNSVSPSGNVSNLYFYDGESPYVPNVNVLEPWEGYFIENRSGEQVVLQVAPVEASPSVPKQNEQTLSRSDFILQISAELEQSSLKDVYNYVGFIEGALPGDDILDQREPPSIGDVVQLSIEDGRSYLSNFKPLPGEGEQWNLSISSTIPNRRVNVKLAEYGSRPERFDIYVLDRDDFNAIPVLNSRFSLNLRDTRRSLKLIIGTKEYAEMNNEGIPLVPLAYTLEQNFPNPFNPSTTIRYALNKRSDVSLSIYNLLGQKVKTLVSGEQITGTYSVVWDGVTESGSGAASGVYLYQLRAGEYRASKKLLLLR